MSIQQGPISKRRIVLTAVGSLGDLHPYIALALGMRERGHEAIVATSACYRQKVEALGLGFRAIRPDSDFVSDPIAMQRIMHFRRGIVRVGRELLLPALRHSYDDILAVSANADLLISHPLMGYATRLVSEMTGIPWVSTMITPLGFLSAYDFPVISVAPLACKAFRRLSPSLCASLIGVAK